MKILITGGAGFIGTHISKLLLDQGHQVLIYDNLSRSNTNFLDKRTLFLRGDLSDEKLLQKALKGIDCVIHLAAFLDVEESVREPLLYAQNNILGLIYLLEAMRTQGVKKIIFSSSCVVYGFPKKLPLLESAPFNAANPYGASKIACEAFLQSYHAQFSFEVVALRYFNPYGTMENHLPEVHAIPKMIKAALNKEPFTLYWKGLQVRDFIYVEDLASAHVAALNLKGYQVFNIGTEKGVKVIEVVKTLEKILGYKIETLDLGERPGDVPANFASSAKFKKATGWKPKYTLKMGLTKTVEWFREKS